VATRCTGNVTLRTVSGAPGAKVLTLAVGSFSLAGGHTVTLALHLTAKARALLARVHALRARATITDEERGRATRTTQTIVTVRAAARTR
jgi:hypothetical protein